MEKCAQPFQSYIGLAQFDQLSLSAIWGVTLKKSEKGKNQRLSTLEQPLRNCRNSITVIQLPRVLIDEKDLYSSQSENSYPPFSPLCKMRYFGLLKWSNLFL